MNDEILRRLDEIIQRLERLEGFPSVMNGAIPQFTHAQRVIIERVCKGESNKHIARVLNLPESTVKARIRDIMHKLTVTNRTQIAIVAAKMKLV